MLELCVKVDGPGVVVFLEDGRKVRINLVRRNNGKGKVGMVFEAPRSIRIFREEVLARYGEDVVLKKSHGKDGE